MPICRLSLAIFLLSLLQVSFAGDVKSFSKQAGVRSVRAESGLNAMGYFVVLSDLHFNPKDGNAHFPKIDHDSNKVLLDAIIKNISEEATNQRIKPDFFLITGDFLAHDIKSACFDHKACMLKAIQYPLQAIWSIHNGLFKTIPLYGVLGNNDSYGGDYVFSSSDGFFKDSGAIFAHYAYPKGAPADFLANFVKNNGSYTVPISATCRPGGAIRSCKTLMVLNVLPFSNQTALLSCGNQACGVVRKQLVDYVNKEVSHDMPVYVAMHIPYTALLGWDVDAKPQLWEKTQLFLECSNQQPHCVKGVFSGHVHLFMRSIQTASNPKHVSTLVAPSVTPINGATPGYLIIAYQRDTGKIMQVQRFYISDYAMTLAGKARKTPIAWSQQVLQ